MCWTIKTVPFEGLGQARFECIKSMAPKKETPGLQRQTPKENLALVVDGGNRGYLWLWVTLVSIQDWWVSGGGGGGRSPAYLVEARAVGGGVAYTVLTGPTPQLPHLQATDALHPRRDLPSRGVGVVGVPKPTLPPRRDRFGPGCGGPTKCGYAPGPAAICLAGGAARAAGGPGNPRPGCSCRAAALTQAVWNACSKQQSVDWWVGWLVG